MTADDQELVQKDIEIIPKLIPLFNAENKRFRCSWGGRGSGKTRTFAKMAAIRAYMHAVNGDEGIILCGREFMNSLDESSMSEIKSAIFSEPWLAAHFDIGEKYIRTRNNLSGKVEFKFVGLTKNLDSIKSKSKILLCWVDEAENVPEIAWVKLIPTVREDESEIWVTWNPEREKSATNQRFRINPPSSYVGVEVNYCDNPWFPRVLELDRRDDKEKRPEQYDHIWGGDYVTVVEGAYYADFLTTAREEKRITNLIADPLMPYKAVWDIGMSDACTIWIMQWVNGKIYFLDYYESIGQDLSYHLNWLRSNGYGNAECILPHDGNTRDMVHAIRYEDHISAAGFETRTIPNQGKGAALKRIEAARRLFPRMYFDEKKTAGGREALGFYHEKRDEIRRIGLGPNHDWASHGSDSFGLGAIAYQEPMVVDKTRVRRRAPQTWMTA